MDIRLLMVEIKMKYKIGVRRFGLINWIGAWTLYKKRSIKISSCMDTNYFFPISIIFAFFACSLFSNWCRKRRSSRCSIYYFFSSRFDIYASNQQAFSHSSSSFMIGKIQGNIVDILYAPLSPAEVTLLISVRFSDKKCIDSYSFDNHF